MRWKPIKKLTDADAVRRRGGMVWEKFLILPDVK